ncbi:hypothetical protein HDE_02443 [Halotydeus destructor]|nr:hypothetical protein HDE_02443 [Halotydeus destructor]
MGSLVLNTLSIFLGLFFVFTGCIKVTPAISKELHKELRRDFVQYAKVFPYAEAVGYKLSPKYYRLTQGYYEIVTGLLLALCPGFMKQVANTLLLMLTLNDLYIHAILKDKFERLAPPIVFSLMLTCRLVIYWQVNRRIKIEAARLEAISNYQQREELEGAKAEKSTATAIEQEKPAKQVSLAEKKEK